MAPNLQQRTRRWWCPWKGCLWSQNCRREWIRRWWWRWQRRSGSGGIASWARGTWGRGAYGHHQRWENWRTFDRKTFLTRIVSWAWQSHWCHSPIVTHRVWCNVQYLVYFTVFHYCSINRRKCEASDHQSMKRKKPSMNWSLTLTLHEFYLQNLKSFYLILSDLKSSTTGKDKVASSPSCFCFNPIQVTYYTVLCLVQTIESLLRMSNLQSGQVAFIWSHLLMQSQWKWWLQGRVSNSSPFTYDERQMQHSWKPRQIQAINLWQPTDLQKRWERGRETNKTLGITQVAAVSISTGSLCLVRGGRKKRNRPLLSCQDEEQVLKWNSYWCSLPNSFQNLLSYSYQIYPANLLTDTYTSGDS